MGAKVETSTTIARARGQFRALDSKVYLDAACIGIAPRASADAVVRYVQRVADCPAQSGTAQHQAIAALREDARQSLARLLNCEITDVALMESATHGLGIGAQALPLEPGDRVLMPDLEFVQMGSVWSQMARYGIGLDIVPNRDGAVHIDELRARIGARTRAVSISSVQWTNGFKVDLAQLSQLCDEQDLFLMVDAAQHLGVLPIDLSELNVDILVSSGHKWLNAPFGAGLMYLSPRIRERLRLPIAGFFAAEPPDATWGQSFHRPDTSPLADFRFVNEARAWEIGGTPNVAGAVALAASVGLALDLGMSQIAAHSRSLTDRLIAGADRAGVSVVSPRHPDARSGIVTLSLGSAEQNVAATQYLMNANIAASVRYTSGVGGIRVSCHYFNSDQDVDLVLDVLRAWRGRRACRLPGQRSSRSRQTPRPTLKVKIE